MSCADVFTRLYNTHMGNLGIFGSRYPAESVKTIISQSIYKIFDDQSGENKAVGMLVSSLLLNVIVAHSVATNLLSNQG